MIMITKGRSVMHRLVQASAPHDEVLSVAEQAGLDQAAESPTRHTLNVPCIGCGLAGCDAVFVKKDVEAV